MAKKPGTGMQLLAIAGGVALMVVAWRFPVPLEIIGAKPTTLLSLVAILLGIIIGPGRACIITALYVLMVILDVPPLLWHLPPASEPFLAVPLNGFGVGLIFAALAAGVITPRGAQSGYPRIAIAVIAGHLAYLIIGIAWLSRFGPWQEAITAVLALQGVAILVKSVAAFAIAVTGGSYVKR
jgi:biotin transporter BioY